jgi:hypothetical protein
VKRIHLVLSCSALSACFVAPAFASGYGPAPFYRPEIGAPSSQRGQSTQTLAAEPTRRTAYWNDAGGASETLSQSGATASARFDSSLFRHH